MEKVTMQTIAALAGVTRTTVSRVLHRPEQVAPATREHVETILREQSYVYNAAAADLTRGRVSTIGLVLPTMRGTAFVNTILTAQQAAQDLGLGTVLGSTQYDPSIEARLLQQFRERRLAGGILVGFCPDNEGLLRTLNKEGIPVIVIWEKLLIPDISYVGFDNATAAAGVTSHLIQLGHKRIGLLLGPVRHSSRVQARLRGYHEALEENGLDFDPALVIAGQPTLREGELGLLKLLEQRPRPTAIFAAGDMLAIGAMRAARRLNLNVPQDLAMAGFDGHELGSYVWPELTTVKVPERQMIRLAFKYLMDKIADAEHRPCARCLKTRLLVRRSCGG